MTKGQARINSVDLEDLKPVDSEDSYSGYIEQKFSKQKGEIDYKNLICVDCKKKKAELIRGTKDYLCTDCFKEWLESRKPKKEAVQEKL